MAPIHTPSISPRNCLVLGAPNPCYLQPVVGREPCQKTEKEALLLSRRAARVLFPHNMVTKVHGEDEKILFRFHSTHHLVLTFPRSLGEGFSFLCVAT